MHHARLISPCLVRNRTVVIRSSSPAVARNHRNVEVVIVTETGRHILVLEAGGDIRQRMSSPCEQRGYRLASATTIEDAFAALRHEAFVLVLAELGPGSLDGLAACRELRQSG